MVELDGYEYVGYVSIPAIGIDLPVMSEWSYPQTQNFPLPPVRLLPHR